MHALDIDEQRLRKLCDGNESLLAHRVDLTNGKAIEAFANDVGTVDVLFNCAGFVHDGTIPDCSEVAALLLYLASDESAYTTARYMSSTGAGATASATCDRF